MSLKEVKKKRQDKNDEFFALKSPTNIYWFLKSKYCKNADLADKFYRLFWSKNDWERAVLILATGKQLNPKFLDHMSISNPIKNININSNLKKQILKSYPLFIDTITTDPTPALSEQDKIDHVLSSIALNYLLFLDSVKKVSADDIKDWIVRNKNDLQYFDLSSLDLSGIDLSGADFKGANLTDCNFKDSVLLHADLSFTDLRNTNFSNCKLQKTKFISAKFLHASFSKADLTDADLTGSEHEMTSGNDSVFKNVDFSGAVLDRCQFYRSDFEGSDLQTAQVMDCLFDDSNLAGTALCEYETKETHVNHNYESSYNENELEDENLFRR